MTFYFYDLETSSGSPRTGRIMQFAGQRTNENFEPIGEPDNILVRLPDDILPDPDAILIHGITPQQTLQDGISEADFVSYFFENIAISGTIFVGYNNIRFDDEFMRLACYRCFYDPYEWHWKDGRGRWDLLDAIRMMRALRPEGVVWPFLDGKPSVKLELMAKENNILHDNAHDALSDVQALIDLTRLFKLRQPKLFSYLYKIRDKREVAKVVEADEAFIYTSGKYESEYLKTSVVTSLFRHPRREASVVYDLRYDPSKWLKMKPADLAKHWGARWGEDIEKLPVKTLQYNKCPAVAPISVLDDSSKARVGYKNDFEKNAQLLSANPDFVENLQKALDILENEQQTRFPISDDPDNQIYDSFWSNKDHEEMTNIRMSDPATFTDLIKSVKNSRLRALMPLYKARNYLDLLTEDEHQWWDEYRQKSMFEGGEKSRFAKVSNRINEILTTRKMNKQEQYLLSELQLYIESIIPG